MMRALVSLLMIWPALAAAQEALPSAAGADAALPRLRPHARVASDLVRIGDLVENAGALAATPIFRAPDLGQTGTVQTRRIVDAVLAHGLTLLDTSELPSVTVERTSRSFARGAIEQRIARALSGQNGLGAAKDLVLTFDRDIRALHVEPSNDADLEVARIAYDPRSGRFDATLDVPGSQAARRLSLRFTGTVVETASVLILTRALARGDVITAEDVSLERRPKAGLGEVIDDSAQAIGLAARRALRAGDALRPGEVTKPQIVIRNEPILISFEMPGMTITLRGKALESGAEGERVNVLNIQSKRTLQGIVIGPGRVDVTNAGQLAAETTASIPRTTARSRVE